MAIAESATSVNEVLNLSTSNTQQLLVEPTLNYENPLSQNAWNIYKYFPGVKSKISMLHLQKPQFNLQPKQPCHIWDPSVRAGARPDQISVESYEMNSEMCADEYDEGCLANIQGDGSSVIELDATSELDEFQQATLSLLEDGLRDDIYLISYFADPNFAKAEYSWNPSVDLSHLPGDQAKRLKKMMTHGVGWWADIRARADKGLIKRVNTNDGTLSGNALVPGNVEDFFQDMWMAGEPILRNWNKNRALNMWPLFLVQTGIFVAYRKYLKSLGTEMANKLILEGTPVPGVLMWEGFPVVEVPEWDMFDNLMNDYDPATGYSRSQRALFTVQQNLCLAHSVDELEGFPGRGLIVERAPGVSNKGKVEMYLGLRLGMGVAQDSLMVAGFNGNRNYVYS